MKYVYACPNKDDPCTVQDWLDKYNVSLDLLMVMADDSSSTSENVVSYLPRLKGEAERTVSMGPNLDPIVQVALNNIRWPVDQDGNILLSERLTWFVEHGMSEKPLIPCMGACGDTAVLIITNAATFYNRGYGYLDKSGCRRDMNLYKVAYDEDPYGYMRQPGELDDLKTRLRKGGKFNPKTRYFT